MAILSAAGALASMIDAPGRARMAALFDPAPDAQLAAGFATQTEIADLSAELTRLRSETRLLALEKEAMAIKIATLEDGFGPITGSIPDPAEPDLAELAPADLAPADPGPAGTPPEAAPAEPDRAAETAPRSVRTIDIGYVPRPGKQDRYATPPTPAPKPVATATPDDASVQAETAQAETDLAALASPTARVIPSAVGQTRFAVQLGTADSMDEVRQMWTAIANAHDILVGRLEPAVAIAEADETIRLRLLAGPFADAGDAIQVCSLLNDRGVDCRAVRSEGQKLVMR